MSGSGQSAPPGWYPDPAGWPRWWDGAQWGPAAQPAPPPQPTAMAVVGHIGFALGGFVVPLILHLTSDERDRFTRSHTSEALNAHLTFLVCAIPLYIAGLVLGSVTGTPGLVAVTVVPIFAAGVVLVVWSIKAAIRAGNHQPWRYPLRITFVHGDFSG